MQAHDRKSTAKMEAKSDGCVRNRESRARRTGAGRCVEGRSIWSHEWQSNQSLQPSANPLRGSSAPEL